MQSLYGRYRADSLPIRGLFGEETGVAASGGVLTAQLTFMDEKYDTKILPMGEDRYIARDGLFELHIADGKLTTSMYGADFVYRKV